MSNDTKYGFAGKMFGHLIRTAMVSLCLAFLVHSGQTYASCDDSDDTAAEKTNEPASGSSDGGTVQ